MPHQELKPLPLGFMRQWLNEERITDPSKLVTTEDLEHWVNPLIQSAVEAERKKKTVTFKTTVDVEGYVERGREEERRRISEGMEKWKEGNCEWCNPQQKEGREIPNWNCKQHAYMDAIEIINPK